MKDWGKAKWEEMKVTFDYVIDYLTNYLQKFTQFSAQHSIYTSRWYQQNDWTENGHGKMLKEFVGPTVLGFSYARTSPILFKGDNGQASNNSAGNQIEFLHPCFDVPVIISWRPILKQLSPALLRYSGYIQLHIRKERSIQQEFNNGIKNEKYHFTFVLPYPCLVNSDTMKDIDSIKHSSSFIKCLKSMIPYSRFLVDFKIMIDNKVPVAKHSQIILPPQGKVNQFSVKALMNSILDNCHSNSIDRTLFNDAINDASTLFHPSGKFSALALKYFESSKLKFGYPFGAVCLLPISPLWLAVKNKK